MNSGGEKGIRTLETVTRLHTFQACAFDHSAISPQCLRPLGPNAGGRTIAMKAPTARDHEQDKAIVLSLPQLSLWPVAASCQKRRPRHRCFGVLDTALRF